MLIKLPLLHAYAKFTGISVGSIFGIYEPDETCMIDDGALDSSLEACITNVCQPGRNLLAAGYCLYSSCHTFVLTVGDGVYGFTLDPYVGEFVLTHSKIQVGWLCWWDASASCWHLVGWLWWHGEAVL